MVVWSEDLLQISLEPKRAILIGGYYPVNRGTTGEYYTHSTTYLLPRVRAWLHRQEIDYCHVTNGLHYGIILAKICRIIEIPYFFWCFPMKNRDRKGRYLENRLARDAVKVVNPPTPITPLPSPSDCVLYIRPSDFHPLKTHKKLICNLKKCSKFTEMASDHKLDGTIKQKEVNGNQQE